MKQWVISTAKSDAERTFPEFPDLVEKLLLERGVSGAEEAKRFLKPDYERDTHDPFLIFGMDRAVERLLRAIKENEKIIIFGDYDADGICGSVVFSDFFRAIQFLNFDIYIPDRYKEGYGLSMSAVKEFIKNGTKVLITVDCGVTNDKEITEAKKHGMDVIVIDHHIVPPKWPPAYAILDPRQTQDTYPFPYLCGSALAFKTISALLAKESFGLRKGWERWLLDVVAIATVADMVPLTGENRVLVYWGLHVLAKTRRLGLLRLYKKAGIAPQRITVDDIGFVIGPRVNAASRMGHATTGFELLTTNDQEEARWVVDRLEKKNNERKQLVEQVLNEVRTRVGVVQNGLDIVVLGNPEWQPGVLGIAANRLLDEYACPVFLWGKGEAQNIKGSCRSRDVNVVELMRALPEQTFDDFGGHTHAGGFSLEESRLAIFEEGLRSGVAKQNEADKTTETTLTLTGEFSLAQVNKKTLSEINQLEPFGIENPRPVFLFRDVAVTNIRRFGADGIHLSFKAAQNGMSVSCMGFWLGKSNCIEIRDGTTLNIAASLEHSTFRGYDELRLRIVDMSESNEHIVYGE